MSLNTPPSPPCLDFLWDSPVSSISIPMTTFSESSLRDFIPYKIAFLAPSKQKQKQTNKQKTINQIANCKEK